MAETPQYTPGGTVEARPLPGAFQENVNVGGGTQAVGEGLGSIAAGARQAAEVQAQQQTQLAETQARDLLDVRYAAAERTVLFGTNETPGFLYQQGQAALNGRAAAEQALAEQERDITAQASGLSPIAQRLVRTGLQARLNAARGQIAEHSNRAQHEYRRVTALAAVANFRETAVVARIAGHPQEADAATDAGLMEVQNLWRESGAGSAALEQASRDYFDDVDGHTIAELSALNRHRDAMTYLSEHRGRMNSTTATALERPLADRAEEETASTFARSAYDVAGGYSGALTNVREYAAAHTMSARWLDTAEREIDALHTRDTRIRTEAQTGDVQAGNAWLGGEGHTWNNMPGDLRSRLTAAGQADNMINYERAIRTGSTEPAGGPVYMGLLATATDHPQEFAQMPMDGFLRLTEGMDAGDRERLLTRRNDILNHRDPGRLGGGNPAADGYRLTMQLADAQLGQFGITNATPAGRHRLGVFQAQVMGEVTMLINQGNARIDENLAGHIIAGALLQASGATPEGRRNPNTTMAESTPTRLNVPDPQALRREDPELWDTVVRAVNFGRPRAPGNPAVRAEQYARYASYFRATGFTRMVPYADIHPELRDRFRARLIASRRGSGLRPLTDAQVRQITEEQYTAMILANPTQRAAGGRAP